MRHVTHLIFSLIYIVSLPVLGYCVLFKTEDKWKGKRHISKRKFCETGKDKGRAN